MKVNQVITNNDQDLTEFSIPSWLKPKPRKTPAQIYRDQLKLNKKAFPLHGLKGKERLAQIEKLAAANRAAREAAEAAVKTLPDYLMMALKGLGIVYVLIQYELTVRHCEAEYQLYLTKPEESMYQEARDKYQAYEWFKSDADAALGKLLTELGVLIGPMAGSKLFGIIGSKKLILGWVPYFGKTSRWISDALAALDKSNTGLVARAAIVTFLETPYGKDFIRHSILGSIFEVFGATSRFLFDAAGKALEAYTGPGSSVTKPVGQAMQDVAKPGSNTEPPQPTAAEKEREAANAKVPYSLKTWEKDGITYIGGTAVTDKLGKLLTGLDSKMQDAESVAKSLGVPNPFDKIPKDPNKKYGRNSGW